MATLTASLLRERMHYDNLYNHVKRMKAANWLQEKSNNHGNREEVPQLGILA